MKISSQIDDVITFLQKKRDEGYKTVELIDDDAAKGWRLVNPTLTFVICKDCPTVLEIDARTK